MRAAEERGHLPAVGRTSAICVAVRCISTVAKVRKGDCESASGRSGATTPCRWWAARVIYFAEGNRIAILSTSFHSRASNVARVPQRRTYGNVPLRSSLHILERTDEPRRICTFCSRLECHSSLRRTSKCTGDCRSTSCLKLRTVRIGPREMFCMWLTETFFLI